MIRFLCQTCGTKVQAPEESAGKSGWCPKCRATFTVPAASAAELAQNVAPTSADDIPPLPGSIGERPAAIAATSSRPASPFEVYGAPGTTPPPPPQPPMSTSPPVEGIPFTNAPAHPELAALNAAPAFDAGDPEAMPEVSVKNIWPLILGGAGALLVLVVLIVIAVGRSTPSSVATDATGAPKQQPEPTPPPRRPSPEARVIVPEKATPEQIIDRAKERAAAKPVVIPKTTGAQQAIFDPAPQFTRSTTRPVEAVVQIKTPALVPPVQVDGTVYFAAKDGTFFGIKADSLELVEKKKLGLAVSRLTREGTRLKADVQPNPLTVLEFPQSIDAVDPEDVEADTEMTAVDGKPVPFAWTQHGSAEKQVVFYQGKYFRPLIGGKTKMMDGDKVTTHSGTPVTGIVMWKIAILPSGPMGYDNTSVYELNEHLRPTKRIINLDEIGRWTSIRVNSSLSGDGKTLCFVSSYNNKARMMVWSLDGSKKFREMPVTYNETVTTPGKRLVAIGDGHLFCGGELTFLPSGEGAWGQYGAKPAVDSSTPTGPVGVRRGSPAPPPPVAANKKVNNFTPPVVVGNKLFVGNAAGNVYVFDTSSFSASGSTGSAATSP